MNTGPGATSANFVANTVMTTGGGNGVALTTTGKSSTFLFMNNMVVANGGGDGIKALGNALANDLTFASNRSVRHEWRRRLGFEAKPVIEDDCPGQGQHPRYKQPGGGPWCSRADLRFRALVEGNDFHNNRVGVAVTGNGTTAGNVDLGGGTLGSTGGNNFKSFLVATPTSYAIGLFNVSSAYAMDAKLNFFTPPPPTVIADGSHDIPAGGKGSIIT